MLLQKYFLILNLIALALISYLLADITSFTIREYLNTASPAVMLNNAEISQQPSIMPSIDYYSVIFKKNIFISAANKTKKTDIKVEPKSENIEEAPSVIEISPLNLRLVGTIQKGGKGYIAFIEEPSTRVQTGYTIGDEIESGVTLVTIELGYIVVERGGVKERIEFPTKHSSTSKRQNPRSRPTHKAKKVVTALSERNLLLDKRYVDNELKNMGRLMTQIRAVPAGKKGFKVFNIAKGSIFKKMGLKNGDFIKRINGVELSSPERAMELYMQLKGVSDVQIDLTRNGVSESYDYSIR